ncbi:MAG: tRNA (guanosine(37)-N1)-methyltransferase TrmD [Pantoea sp. Brub]|nr:tRNA (guanosine(37)-N1)-methyltransferase TrmD [Pantoea sp. Brub]
MWIGIISLFPEMFNIINKYGIISRGISKGLLNIKIWNPRDFTSNKYKNVDDRPYGGGSGMLLMFQPLKDAIFAAKAELGNETKVIYLSPQGHKLDQQGILKLVQYTKIILVCGRYKGIDERIIETEIDEEWSIGDYIVSGGELPAMVIIDSISRHIPGVLGHKNSIKEDSFFNGLLDCPQYTRPNFLEGKSVPQVLLSGKHFDIQQWRLKQSLGRTWLRRPDLLNKIILSETQLKLLIEFQKENKKNK